VWRALLLVGAFVLAAALALIGLILFALSNGCLDYCDEPDPFSQRWYWGVWVLLPIWGCMYGAMRALRVGDAGRASLALTAYVGAVMALAIWFSEDEVILGDGPWIAFWAGALLAWAALTAALARRPANRG
jgi:hypothetical protein